MISNITPKVFSGKPVAINTSPKIDRFVTTQRKKAIAPMTRTPRRDRPSIEVKRSCSVLIRNVELVTSNCTTPQPYDT